MSKPNLSQVILGLSVLLFLFLSLQNARSLTPTIDEFAHVPSGVSYWKEKRFDLYPKNPPLGKFLLSSSIALSSELQLPPAVEVEAYNTPAHPWWGWSPWIYGMQFMQANPERYFQYFFQARIPVILITLLTAWILFSWCKETLDKPVARYTASFFLLSPNIIAHGSLATLDLMMTGFFLLHVYLIRKWIDQPTPLRASWIGVCLGASCLIKFTALLLIPLSFCFMLFPLKDVGPDKKNWILRRFLPQFSWVLLLSLWVIQCGYGFHQTFQPWQQFTFYSDFMNRVTSWIPGFIPSPFPADWLLGFDLQKWDAEHGEFGSYLMGNWSQQGFWYYNLFALLMKLPVLTLVLAFMSLVWIRQKSMPWVDRWMIRTCLVFFLVMFTVLVKLNIGIRYLLPIFPFLWISIAAVLAFVRRTRWFSQIMILCFLSYASTAIFYQKDHLRYFSEWVGGRTQGANLLIDSNYDWGQDLYQLGTYLEEYPLLPGESPYLLYFGLVSPKLYGIEHYEILPNHPVPGLWVVSENFYRGMSYIVMDTNQNLFPIPREHTEWLRDKTPTHRLGSLLIFDERGLKP